MAIDQQQPDALPVWRSWLSPEQWRERIITFDASWFVLTMGTGVIIQNLNYFPYPAQWLKNLGYCFWILEIVLFGFFLIMTTLRTAMYPSLVLQIFNDFQQTSYLGAIPISLDTISTGIVLYYNQVAAAVYVAEVFFWISVALSALVGFGGLFVMYRRQGKHQLGDVTGVWFLTFIPMIVTAALGSTLVTYTLGGNQSTILVISWLMLSLGLGVSFLILGIYLWRLMACHLPPRDAIVSCFVPVGPLGMGAFTTLQLAIGLARLISTTDFEPQELRDLSIETSSRAAVALAIQWLGIIASLGLIGLATCFLVEAFASVLSKLPKNFNIGFWSFVFPCGVYSNAFCRLSLVLSNDGMRGWAALCVVSTVLLWLICAILTTYKGVWCGKLFVSPGLLGDKEQEEIEMDRHLRENKPSKVETDTESAAQSPVKSTWTSSRNMASDGTYQRSWTHAHDDHT